jgi:phospholipase/carboxylesterase
MAHRRLEARPQPVATAGPPGLTRLDFGEGRDGLLYVPHNDTPMRPAPLILVLHGAGGNAQHGINLFMPVADGAGLILLAPDSRGRTWDIILGEYGPDVAFIDRALAHVFARYAVDPARVVISGFSDGASYALSLGLMNGDLFPEIIAFSPGFAAPAETIGTPRIYISHGINDAVLPIDRCSRRLVSRLADGGYDVAYHEFAGPHTVPPEIVTESITWLLNNPTPGVG